MASGGRGSTLIALEDGETIKAVLPATEAGLYVNCQSGNGKIYQVKVGTGAGKDYNSKRARKGRVVESRFTPIGLEPVTEDAL